MSTTGNSNEFLLLPSPENDLGNTGDYYLGQLKISGGLPNIWTNYYSVLASVTADNAGAGGAARLIFNWDTPLLVGAEIWMAAWMPEIRGQHGEWISSALTITRT